MPIGRAGWRERTLQGTRFRREARPPHIFTSLAGNPTALARRLESVDLNIRPFPREFCTLHVAGRPGWI